MNKEYLDTPEAIHDDFLGRKLSRGQAACLLVRIKNISSSDQALKRELVEALKIVQSRVRWKDYGPIFEALITRAEATL